MMKIVFCGLIKTKDNSPLVIQPFFYNLCNSNPAADSVGEEQVKITVDPN